MDVELKGLKKSFGKVIAVNNMNLEIERMRKRINKDHLKNN